MHKCEYEKCKESSFKDSRYCKVHDLAVSTEKRVLRFYSVLGIPTKYKKVRITDIKKSILDSIDITKSMLFIGKPGRGKTYTAIAILSLDANKEEQTTLFITMTNLLRNIKATYDKNSEVTENDIFKKYSKADVLCIDDLGVEKVSEWVLEAVYCIINHRHNYNLKTIFTSNYNLDQLSDKFGDRIASRIFGMCKKNNIVDITGHDRRLDEEGD